MNYFYICVIAFAQSFYGMNYNQNPKFYLQKYFKEDDKAGLVKYLKKIPVLQFINSDTKIFDWAAQQTNNPSLLRILLLTITNPDHIDKCKIKKIYDEYHVYKIKKYIEKGETEKLLSYLECHKKEFKKILPSQTTLFSWAAETATNDQTDVLKALLTYGVDIKECNVFLIEKVYNDWYFSEIKRYIKTEDPNGLHSFINKKHEIKTIFTTDKTLFTWATEKTDDPVLLKCLIDYGIYTDESHEKTVENITIAAQLKNYLSVRDEQNFLQYLKKKEVKEYLANQKKLFFWAINQTKDPFFLKHLVDNGINLDPHMGSEKYDVFYFVTKKLYFHHYDLIFALVARHISANNTNKQVSLLQNKLNTCYKKFVPFFCDKKPEYYTIFRKATMYQKKHSTEIHALRNRAAAIKILDPELWSTNNEQRESLIKEIFEYRKKHCYDEHSFPSYMQKDQVVEFPEGTNKIITNLEEVIDRQDQKNFDTMQTVQKKSRAGTPFIESYKKSSNLWLEKYMFEAVEELDEK